METFDEYISSKREQFNDCIPPLGHEQRFMARLQKRKRTRFIRITISSVASVLLVVGLTAVMTWFYQDNLVKSTLLSENFNTTDVEVYYNTLLLEKYKEVERVIYTERPELKFELTRIMQDFERENRSLRNDFGKSQKKDYMVGLIVHSYQTQIDILDKIQLTINQ